MVNLDPPGAKPTGTGTGRARLLACAGAFLVFLQVTQTVASLREMQADFSLSTADIAWVPSAYTLLVAAGVLSASALADRYGRRAIFRLGIAGLLVGGLVLVGAGNFTYLLIGQAIAGAGAALVLPSSLALVLESAPAGPAQNKAIAGWAAASGAGLAIGPVNAGLVLEWASWNAVFVLNAVVASVVLVVAGGWLDRGPTKAGTFDLLGAGRWIQGEPKPSRTFDVAGSLLAVPAMGSLVYFLIEGGRDGYTSSGAVIALAVAVVTWAMLLVTEWRAASPMLDVRLMARPSYSGALIVAATVLFCFVGVTILQVLWLSAVADLSVLEGALHLQFSMAAFIAGSILSPLMARRLGVLSPLAVGLLLAAAGAGWFSTISADSSLAVYAPMFATMGLGCGLANASSTAMAVASVPPHRQGTAFGTVNAARQLGAVVGTSMLGGHLSQELEPALTESLAGAGLSRPQAIQVAASVSDGTASASAAPEEVLRAVADGFTAAVADTSQVAALVTAGGLALFLLFALAGRRSSHSSSRTDTGKTGSAHASQVPVPNEG